ncbi:MAG: VOC family protein [Bacteroidetes bacterium]|nr:MAG: VOC family protein [Bacteroidota bacterium]
MSNKNPVVHFEMPYENHERLIKFYSNAFGWELQKMGEEMGNYITAATAETDENRMVKTPGTINGGFFPKNPELPSLYPSVVIAVDNIKESMKKITELGGEVFGEPVEIPGIGQYVSFADTEGNRISILQPAKM